MHNVMRYIPPAQGFFRIIKSQGGGTPPPKTPSPPSPDQSDHSGKNEIYNRENLVRPFLVHQVLGPKPPPPLPPPLLKRSPAPAHATCCTQPPTPTHTPISGYSPPSACQFLSLFEYSCPSTSLFLNTPPLPHMPFSACSPHHRRISGYSTPSPHATYAYFWVQPRGALTCQASSPRL